MWVNKSLRLTNMAHTSLDSWHNRRVKTPTVLQMEAVECGAAALGIVLGYHGRIVPLESLRLECGVSRDGSKASNIVKAARKYGMEAKGFKKELDGLQDMPLPMILFWNFNHFVVLEGIKKNRVYINDPALGPKIVTREDLDQAFTGVVLTFKPGPDFKKGGNRRSLIRAFRKRLVGSGMALTFTILTGLFLVIPGLVIPTFSKIFVDDLLIGGMNDWIKPLLLGMGVAALCRALLTWLQERYLLRFQTKLALSSSAQFFHHVMQLPIEFFTQRFGGEIGSRVQINDRVAQLLSGQLATTMLNIVMIAFYSVLMFQYDVILTLVGIFIALFNLVALRYVSRKRVDLNQRLLQEKGKLLGTSMSGLQTIETLKATGTESDFFARWAGYQAKVMNAQQNLGFLSKLLSAVPPLLMSVNNVAILGVGGLRIMEGGLSMGMLVAFQSLMTSFLSPVQQMVDLGGQLQEAQGDMNRLDDVVQYPVDRQFSQKGEHEPFPSTKVKLNGHLEVRNISFGYSILDPPLIDNFSLTLKPGSRVALVGASGSGKSTIAKIVTGLFEPWEGEILFDEHSRLTIERSLLNNSLAMVDQEIFMFEGKIKDNLTLWDSTIPEADIIRATKDACIHDDIAARTRGYESNVGENGNNFSGGQCQRLEIARALVGNPTILILDEATSALDPNTEKIIDYNLRRRGVTCLIVAHRLSTIRDCDEIIVLERGKVVQRGTHEEMRDGDGVYAQLIRAE